MRTFREAVQSGDFSISAEIALKKESTAADVHHQADALEGLVDGIQVNDNPWSWVQMSAVAASALILNKGMDPVPILTCRDRNRIALQSDLLGLRAMGVTSVLLTRGHRVPQNHVLPTTAVFDTTGRELVAMANSMNEELPPGTGQHFFIGTGARAFRPGEKWRAESLMVRALAGAQFMQTQLCFNTDIVRSYAEALVREKVTWKYSVIVSLAVLPSLDTAIWLKKNLVDSKIPPGLMKRLSDADDGEAEGIKICAELIQEISQIPGISGVNLMSMGNPDVIPLAIRASGLRT